MALETATNPTTGERFALINNEWKPFSETATNPTTKEKFGLIDNAWQSLGISAEAPVPQEDTPIGAGVRSAIEKAPGALGGLAGFGASFAALQGLGLSAGAAVGAAFPPAAPVTAPVTYAAVTVIGSLIGATIAGTAVDTASDYLFSQADPDGWKLRQEEKKRNPTATTLGDVASGLLGMSPATITRGLLKSTGERAVSGTLQGALSAGGDVLVGQAPDWQKAGAQTVAGFAMPSFNRLGQSAFNLGQGASRAVLPNSWTKTTPEVTPKAPIVDESGTIKSATTADEESAFIRKLNESIEAKKAAAEAGSSGEPPPPPRIESTIDVTSNTAVDEVSRVQKQIDSIDNPVLKKMAIEGSVIDPKMAEITTVSALAEHIKTTLGPDHLASRVLDALLPTLPKDSPSRVLKADEYEALYKSVGGTDKTTAFWHDDLGIVMRDGFGNNAITGAHEIAHAVLHSKIEAIKSLPVNHPDYIKLTKLVTDVTELMNSVRSKVEVTPENKALFDYSLNDPHEFIANGIFKPRLADALLKIEQKQPGFVSKLVSYIGKFLGLEPKQYTALHELIRLTQRLAKAENPDVQVTGLGPKGSKLSQDIQDSVLGEQSKNEENIAVAHTSPIRIRNETPHGGDTGWRGNVGRGEDAAVFGVGTNVSTGTNVNNKYRDQFQPHEELVLTTTSADGTPTTTKKTTARYSPEKELWDEINYMEVRSVYGVPFFENIFSKYARKKGIERITRHYKEELNDTNGAFPDNPFVTGHRKLVAAEKLDLLKKYDWINAKIVDPAIGKFMGEEAPTFHMTLKAKPEEIMDWNAPISEQNPKVQAKVQKLLDRFFPALPENLSWTEAKDEKFRIPISAWTAQIGETKYIIKEKTDLVTPTNERYYQLLQYSKVGDGWSADTTIGEFSTLEQAKIGKPDPTGEAIYHALQKNFNKIEFDLEYKRARYRTSTNLKQKDALGKELDVEEKLLHLDYYVPEEYKSAALATEQLQSLGLVAHVFNSNAGQGTQFRNYIVYDDARLKTNAISFVKGSLLEESPAIVKASKDIDVRSLVENEFIKHAEQIYANEGEEAALAFFRDWKQHSTDKRISLPNTEKGLADTFFKLRTWAMADRMRYRVAYDATTYGREISMRERFFPSEEMAIQKEQMDGIREIAFREREGQNDPQFLAQRAEVEANPELKAKYDFLTERLKAGDTEVTALIQRIRTLTGDDRVVAGLETGQARYIMKSKKERTLEELLGGGKDNPLIESNKEASSIKGRSLFQLEDGRVIQVEKVGDVEMVLEWKLNKEGTPFPSVWADKDGSYHAVPGYIAKGKPGEALTAGSIIRVAGKDMVIKDGQVHNIERLTPYRYFKDAEATQYKKIMELEKMARELELIDKMKENKFFNLAAGPDAEKIPAGWKQITDVDTLPQLRGWSFDPKVAWIIEDFAKTWDKGLYLRSTDFLIKNMMLVPIPHIFNEAAHLWALRGLSGWVTPKGLTRFGSTLGPAFKDVAEQGRFYQEVAKEGGSLLGADPRNNEVFNAMGRDYVERAVKIPAVKAALAKVGYSVADFYNAWSQNSQKSMWFTRDVMYMQALREIIKLNETRGTPVTTKQAIDLVQDHMPAYRLPTVIMNSRLLSKALQNPYLAVFSRYHYGVTKSIANISKELNPQNLKTTEGRQEFKDGIDRMLATVVAMTIGYAAVDAALEVVFGPGTKMRRAGPFHLYHAVEEAVKGNKDASALLFAVFTFNPVTSTLGQLATNRQLYKNKYPEIYHPNDPIEDKASDVASYLGRSIPQAGGILRASDQDNYPGLLAKQFDVQIKTPEQIRASEKSKKREDTELKYRKIKREQGVYRP